MTKKKFLLSNVMQTKLINSLYNPVICDFDVLGNIIHSTNKQRIYLWVLSNSNYDDQQFKLKGCSPNSNICTELSQITVDIQSRNQIYYKEHELRVEMIDIWREKENSNNFYVSLNNGDVRITIFLII